MPLYSLRAIGTSLHQSRNTAERPRQDPSKNFRDFANEDGSLR